MKTVTPQQLTIAYRQLFPDELPADADHAEAERILGNWLARYENAPEKAIAKANWYGKATKALFRALGIEQPKTVKEMLDVLRA